MKKKLKSLLSRVIALSFGLVMAVAFVEVSLRFLGHSTREIYTATQTQFEETPGIYEPSQTVLRLANPSLPHTVNINSLGYRGRELSREKDSTETRIFLAGDSFVFGDFVEEDQTLPYQLEEILGQQCGSVKVVNAGLLGGTIIGESEMIERGLSLSPDLVVLVYHENDIPDLRNPLWNGLEHNREVKSHFPMSVLYPMLRSTAIWNFALEVRASLRNSDIVDSEKEEKLAGSDDAENSYRAEYRSNIDTLYTHLQEEHVPFNYAIYPGHKTLAGSEVEKSRVQWADLTANELHIPTLNLSQALSTELEGESGYLVPLDGHPSPAGHMVAAKAMANFLLQQEPLHTKCATQSAEVKL